MRRQQQRTQLWLLLCMLVCCAVVLLVAVHERAVNSLTASHIRVSSTTAAAAKGSSLCAHASTHHHHPLLLQQQQQHQQLPANSSSSSSALIPPSQAQFRASRAELLAHLDSPAFAAEAQQLSELSGQRWEQSRRPARGILIVAGGRQLLTHLVVQLKVLRETLGCTLPVEVAWQGTREMDNATLSELQARFGPLRGFDVQAAPYASHMPRVDLSRWVGKVAALLHCSFREVLLLDSDNLPLSDPAYLFEDPLYRQHGNLFWPDFWSDWVKPAVFPWLGLNATVVKPQLRAGAGFLGRDAESGMLLLDRERWRKVLYLTMLINTKHQALYYKLIHGDKDTFALAFALAGEADKYRQVSVGPGGVFRWGKDQLEIKATNSSTPSSTADGWQLMGALQFDDTGRPAFFHRTMNKLRTDEEPWPAELVTGPLPSGWLAYFLAHNSRGPTKGVWWEHVAPATAFRTLPANSSTTGCLFRSSPTRHEADSGSAPIPALRVGAGTGEQQEAVQPLLRAIDASLDALRWLKGEEGRAAFPSLDPAGGSTMA